ncbi:MAG: thioredoxin-disulfide reductase [Negativicutes bacterium]|nr:thioredoxin-disulfide reductase [Negativicutes bacterium]
MPNPVEIAIIGSGPAGMAAALYAGRAGKETVILEKAFPGGQAFNTYLIENYPGIKKIGGPDFTQTLSEQALSFGTRMITNEVTSVDLQADPKRISFADGSSLAAKAVILAMGAMAKKLGVPGEEKLTGLGVSYCATCDGAFFKDRHVVVVGGGDAALEEALFLTRFAASVTILHRRNEFRATQVLQDRVRSHPKIVIKTPYVSKEVIGERKVTALEVQHVETGVVERIPCDGIFVYVGFIPMTQLAVGQLEMDNNYIVANDATMATSLPGVYAAGDLRVKKLRQIVTAVADGALAATSADLWLESKE